MKGKPVRYMLEDSLSGASILNSYKYIRLEFRWIMPLIFPLCLGMLQKHTNIELQPIAMDLFIHGDRQFIYMSRTPLKCGAFYCDTQPYSCSHQCVLVFSCVCVCVCVRTLYKKVHAFHPYGTNLGPTHPPTQEDASLCCSWRLMHGWIYMWHNWPCTNT